MEILLEEHGEALFYGIVGILMVFIICTLIPTKYKNITPKYSTYVSRNNDYINKSSQSKKPIIIADEIIYATYKSKEFNIVDFIKAKDFLGNDITSNLDIYGSVNVEKKGIYKLRCVVMASNALTVTKYVNVIVE